MAKGFKPGTTIAEIAFNPIMDKLSRTELVVYLRIVALSKKRGRRFKMLGREVYKDAKTVTLAMQSLHAKKLIRYGYDLDRSRTVELV